MAKKENLNKSFLKTIISSGIIATMILATALIPFNIVLAQAPIPTSQGGPQSGQIGVPIDALVDRQFSVNLNAATVTTSNVRLQANAGNTQGGDPSGSPNLCTTVELINNNQVKCNHSALSVGTWYTFTITTGVTSATGTPLASAYTSSFQTSTFGGGAQYNPPPSVNSTTPPMGGTLPSNGKVKINFSTASMRTSGEGSILDFNNIQLFALSGGAVTGSNLFLSNTTGSWDGVRQILTITPPTLTVGTSYRLIIKADNDNEPGNGSCGGGGEPACVMTTDNLALLRPDYLVDFQVTATDSTAPTVIGSFPDTGATNVDRANYDFSISFNEPLDPATVSTSTVKLYCNDTDNNAANGCNDTDSAVDGNDPEITGTTVATDFDGRSVHLSPNQILPASSNFIIRIVGGANGVKDIIGNAAVSDLSIRTFSTGTNINGQTTDNTAPTVMFANADNFGVFITLSEAMKFDAIANVSQSSSNGVNDVNNLANWTLENSPDGTNWAQIPLTGKTVSYEAHNKTLQIENLALPPNNQFKVTGSTNIQDLSNNGLASANRTAQGTVKTTQETGGMLGPGGMAGPTNFFDMGIKPIMAFPKSALAGATTRYKIEFPAETAITASGKITLTYPSGFSFTSGCNTWLTDTFENADINGPATGTVTVSSIACDSISRVVTITLGSTATQTGDMLRFEIQGVVNSTTPKDFSTSGYQVDIKTYNASNVLLESKTSMPFFINTPGARSISGKVFNDTDSDGILDAGETGIASIRVCMGGPFGFECKTTDASGDYSFTQLNDGFYHIDIPPLTSGNYTGGPFFRDVNVSGSNVTGVNFGLQAVVSANILDVYVSGGTGLANQKLDVFAFSTMGAMPGATAGPGPGGFVVRELTLNSSGIGTTTLPLSTGKWQVGVGPWMPKEPGSPPAPPDFTFMPPKPVEVQVDATTGVPDLCTTGAGAANELCFTLTASANQIKGKVVDGSGSAIANVFVMARPSFFEATGPGGAGLDMSDTNGLFDIKVVTGTYIVEAFMPGMPPSNSFECTVKDNSSNTDNNTTADVYCQGTLIENDISGFSGASITLGNVTANDLILTIAKGDTSISGRVLDDSGNAIAFAHVSGMEVDDSGNPQGGWADAPTDNSGNYTLYVRGGTEASPKKWQVRAFAPGFGELPAITVAVVQGQNATGKNLQVQSGQFFTVSGQILQGSTGVQGVFVNAYGLCGGNGTATDASGNYSLKLRGTGSCTPASDDESYTIEGFVPGQGQTNRLTGVNVTANLTGQNLTFTAPGTIVAYVCTLTNTGASPSATNGCGSNQITDAFVDAKDSSGRGNGTGSNPTAGKYEIVVPAGTYTVKANNPAIGLIGSQLSVAVTANQTTYINIVPPTLYQVSGTVTSASTACIEGVTVVLTDSTNGRVKLAKASSLGAWSVNIPNGTYIVNSGKPGCVDSADAGSVVVSGANITQANDTDLARTLTKANATVSGRVLLSNANVTFPTMVFATTSSGKIAVAEVDISQTGTNNNYTLDLTADTWTIRARSDGYESSTVSLTVTANSSTTQNLTLTAISGYTRKEAKPYSVAPSRGGIVKNTDISSDFEVNIPAGALGTSSNEGSVLTKETTAVVDAANDNIDVLGDKGIEIVPKDASGQPISTLSSSEGGAITLTIPYNEADVTAAGSTENKVSIAAWSDEKGQWEVLPTTCDTTNNKCTATVTHFSDFALLVPTGGGAPSTPTGLSATAASSSQIDLSWTVVSGATGYNIYRDTSASGNFPRLGSEPTISSGSTTSYSDTGLTASTTYYYKVSAKNASGESAASSAVSATTQSAGGGGGVVTGDFNPPAISDIKVSAGSTSATITWKTNEASISWILSGQTSDYGKETKTTTYITSHSATLSDLSASTTYHYQIKSKDSAGNVGTYTDQTFITLATGEEVKIPVVEKPISEMTIAELQAKIAEILAAIQQLQVQLAQLKGPAITGCTITSFNRDLRRGSTGDDVKCLQIILNSSADTRVADSDAGSPGNETNYFGSLTKAAVIKFQEKYFDEILTPWGFTEGTGFVAKTTRAKLNSLIGK